ncbi:MAG TPA: glycerol-3-phosphate dehydrogenase/oxidase [Actinomycetota bacterium]|nr:glycerol-3-phosphate dehydrogenase/oxidase [Actinomycetota bacterium]
MSGLRSRSSALERLEASATEPFDLLVVGGGITGAGIALDAASRGMSVGLVERNDFASGTSSKSSKLVHGGLRYLEQRELGLVREAAQERDLLRELAPHLVEPIPFVLPIADRWMRAKFGVGLWAYDALASFKNLKVHRYLGVDETEAAVPPIPEGKIKGGFLFYDCKNDDVRLVMEVLMQAVRHGAVVANYTPVRDLSGSETMCTALVEDATDGRTFEVRARRIVVAAGVWADRLEAMANPDADPRLRPSKGIHLSFRRERLPVGDAAAFIPDAARRRMLFIIPWLDAVIVGTTDTAYPGDIDNPTVDAEDRAYCLDAVNAVFHLDLTDKDITGAWAGLRPLVAGRAGSTADLSRRHAVYDIAPGIRGITGGKLTTYRRMAKDAVDLVAEDLDVEAPSRTRSIRLGSTDLEALRVAVERRCDRLGIPAPAAANLVRCYGDRSLAVLERASEDGLAEPIVPGAQPIAAEIPYCAENEMVLHLSDLLQRRTRLSLTDPAAGLGDHSLAAKTLADSLGWDLERVDREKERVRSEVEKERGISLGEELHPADVPTASGAG